MGKGQLRKYFYMPLIKLFATILLSLIVGVVLFPITKDNVFEVATIALAVVFLKRLLPFLVIAIRHIRISNGVSFSIDKSSGKYRYCQGSTTLLFDSNQIKKVVKVVSPPKFDNRFDLLGFGDFFYWKITLTDNKMIAISCLVLDIENFFGMYLEQEKKIFVFPPLIQFPDPNIPMNQSDEI